MHTFVIAEAGSCHDGDLNKAYQLVDLAERIGADAVKFQWVSNPSLLAHRRNAPEYLEAYRTIWFPRYWFDSLALMARRKQLEFMCTVYLPEDIAVVEPYVSRFKISSFEADDEAFVEAHREYCKEIIVSCGMASDCIYDGNVSYLHCVSAYPTPVGQINLARLHRDSHGGYMYDGLSDHTTHPWTGALAVAAGARILEFHVRLQGTDLNNPDYVVARDPTVAAEYVRNVRLAETMMGTADRSVQPAEEKMLRYKVQP